MKKIIIYTGLSLPFEEAKKILDTTEDAEIIYKRPIQRGDIGEALKENPNIIAIVDGVFQQASPVAHKEILQAINSGVEVLGSSSMGALRASELDSLGMKGIGYVYNAYATGKIASDDDVAVVMDSETLEPLSVPLVNMDYVFTNAVNENVISEDEKNELIKIAKETFYPKRNYTQLFKECSLKEDKKDELIDFVNSSPDIKKEDAKELLQEKISNVKNFIKDKKIAISFSGGADSTLIAYLAAQVSDNPIAITVDNKIMPEGFVENAKEIAGEFGLKHIIIDIDFFKSDIILNNPNRCFLCRKSMYEEIKKGWNQFK